MMKGVLTRLLARSSLITLFTLLALSPMLAGIVHAQGTTASALIPLPLHVERDAGEFHLTTATRLLIGDKSLRPVAKVIATPSASPPPSPPAVSAETGHSFAWNSIAHSAVRPITSPWDAAGVRIAGGDSAGVFYGAQTLLQLRPVRATPKARVTPQACARSTTRSV
jgi:hypothetical protein